MSLWIDANERLPEPNKLVWVKYKIKSSNAPLIMTAIHLRIDDKGRRFWRDEDFHNKNEILQWGYMGAKGKKVKS